MSSSSLLCRSWGLNHGEEHFLGPVAMVTMAWCSAACPHCYLSEQACEFDQVHLDDFPPMIADMQRRGAKAVYLVNPERQTDALAKALQRLRERGPKLPVVLKLGGHESAADIEPLLSHVDACSLDVKTFQTETAVELGCPDLLARVDRLMELLEARLGKFRRDGETIKGWWVRHVGLPGRVHDLEPGMRRRLTRYRPPIWLTPEYRPFGRARSIESLNRRLSAEEREIMSQLVQTLATEGWPAWLR